MKLSRYALGGGFKKKVFVACGYVLVRGFWSCRFTSDRRISPGFLSFLFWVPTFTAAASFAIFLQVELFSGEHAAPLRNASDPLRLTACILLFSDLTISPFQSTFFSFAYSILHGFSSFPTFRASSSSFRARQTRTVFLGLHFHFIFS